MRRARRLAGLSQQQLADAAGVYQPYICALEQDAHEPQVGLALRLARALHTTVEALFDQEEQDDGLPFVA